MWGTATGGHHAAGISALYKYFRLYGELPLAYCVAFQLETHFTSIYTIEHIYNHIQYALLPCRLGAPRERPVLALGRRRGKHHLYIRAYDHRRTQIQN